MDLGNILVTGGLSILSFIVGKIPFSLALKRIVKLAGTLALAVSDGSLTADEQKDLAAQILELMGKAKVS